MLNQIIDKQRRAASVIKTALLGVGIAGRAILVQANSHLDKYGRHENYAVFVSAPIGSDIEPYYETGKSIIECVGKIVETIKRKGNDTKTDDQSEIAPL